MYNKATREAVYSKAKEMGFEMENHLQWVNFYKDGICIKQVSGFKKAYSYLWSVKRTLDKGGTPGYVRILQRHYDRNT